MNSRNALDAHQMRAQLVVGVVVPALTHQVEVVIAQQVREGVRIVNLERFAGLRAPDNLVAARRGRVRLLGRQPRLKEAFRAQLPRVRQLCRSDGVLFNCYALERNTRLRRPRQKEPDRPSLRDRVRPQQRKRIREVTADKRTDLRIDPRIDTAAARPVHLAFHTTTGRPIHLAIRAANDRSVIRAYVLRRQPLSRVRMLSPGPRIPLQAASSLFRMALRIHSRPRPSPILAGHRKTQ